LIKTSQNVDESTFAPTLYHGQPGGRKQKSPLETIAAGFRFDSPGKSQECESSKPTSAEAALHGHKIFFKLFCHHFAFAIREKSTQN